MDNNSKFWSIIFIILGAGLMLYAIKGLIIPFIAFVLGFLLINHGLRMRHKLPLIDLLKGWFEELMQ